MSNLVSLPDRRGLVAEVAENVRVECARRGWKQTTPAAPTATEQPPGRSTDSPPTRRSPAGTCAPNATPGTPRPKRQYAIGILRALDGGEQHG